MLFRARARPPWFVFPYTQLQTALIPRRAGPNGDFRATRHFQIVATFNEDRAGPGADGRADGRAFTTAGDCADEGANRAADRRSRHRTRSLAVVVRHISFSIHAHPLAVRRQRVFNGSGEVIRPAVTHPDA